MTIGDDRATELLRLAHEITDLEGRLAECVAELVDLDCEEGGATLTRLPSCYGRPIVEPSAVAPPNGVQGPASSWTWAPEGESTFRHDDPVHAGGLPDR